MEGQQELSLVDVELCPILEGVTHLNVGIVSVHQLLDKLFAGTETSVTHIVFVQSLKKRENGIFVEKWNPKTL